MASLKAIIFNTRPCYVKTYDDEFMKAMFHGWFVESQVIPPSALAGGHNGGTVTTTFGLVELEDGSMRRVHPYEMKFIDHSEFYQYDWTEEEM